MVHGTQGCAPGPLDALAGAHGRTAFLAGAGGCGMRGLAHFLLAAGWQVWGADSKPFADDDDLLAQGLQPMQQGAAAPQVSLAVRSAAVPENEPGFQSALAEGARPLKYAELLGEISQLRPVLAVAGSHGKTTVTSWAAWGLRQAGIDVGYLVGADVPQLPGSAHWGDPTLPLIAETCEYDRSFHAVHAAQVALINVDAEHPDTYPGGLLEVTEAFEVFLAQTRVSGCVFAGLESPDLSTSTCAEWSPVEAIPSDWSVGLPGEHNRRNAALVAAVLRSFDLDEIAVQAAIEGFRGAARRMESLGFCCGAQVISDYAHHPIEVEATLQAAREAWPESRIHVVFQPHQAQRLHAYREQFAPSLDGADTLFLLPVFRARDPEEIQASVEELIPDLLARNPNRLTTVVSDFAEARRLVCASLQSGDILLALGAGSIDAFARHLVDDSDD